MITLKNQAEFDLLVGNEVFEVKDSVILEFDLVAPGVDLRVGETLKGLSIDAKSVRAVKVNLKGNLKVKGLLEAERVACVKDIHAGEMRTTLCYAGNIKVVGDIHAMGIYTYTLKARDVYSDFIDASHSDVRRVFPV